MMVLSMDEIEPTVKALRADGYKIVTTNGCFDILHVGHIRYLKEARSYGDVLIVLMNNDASVQRLKGRTRPFVLEDERAEVLDALWAVDYVIIFSDDTPDTMLRAVQPDIHVKGGDYNVEDLPEAAVIKEIGGIIQITGKIAGKSTTELVSGIMTAIASNL